MAEGESKDNKISVPWDEAPLQVRRWIDQEIEKSNALNPRGCMRVRVRDKENHRIKLSRHEIAEVMPINVLSTLLIPEFSEDRKQEKAIKENRRLLEKKIIYSIEFNGLKCAYVTDISIPFANLADNQKRRAEISIHEFIRIYESGRLYSGAEKDIERWQSELARANEEYKIIKGVIPTPTKNNLTVASGIAAYHPGKTKRTLKPNTLKRYKRWYERYLQIEREYEDKPEKFSENKAHEDIAGEEKADVSTIAKGIKAYLATLENSEISENS